MPNKAVLFSIKPRFVDLISCGIKRFELRRKCPKVDEGDLALVYETSPTMSLVGAFLIGRIVQKSPASLWKEIGKEAGVGRVEFMEYFEGCVLASAIEIGHYWPLDQRVSLDEMRSKNQIEPPQSFRYLCQDMAGKLLEKEIKDIGSMAR